MPSKKNEDNKKTERHEYKNKEIDGVCYHCGQKGHMSKDCCMQKNGHYKNLRKQKKPLMEMEMIWCYVH